MHHNCDKRTCSYISDNKLYIWTNNKHFISLVLLVVFNMSEIIIDIEILFMQISHYNEFQTFKQSCFS